jgi:hypothetical protein
MTAAVLFHDASRESTTTIMMTCHFQTIVSIVWAAYTRGGPSETIMRNATTLPDGSARMPWGIPILRGEQHDRHLAAPGSAVGGTAV